MKAVSLPRVADGNSLDLSDVLSSRNLDGEWEVEDEETRFRFMPSGNLILVSLEHSASLAKAEGILLPVGEDLRVQQLVYHTKSGKTFDLRGSIWKIINANQIKCRGTRLASDTDGKYVRSATNFNFTLSRRNN